jgi:hypothetical protein
MELPPTDFVNYAIVMCGYGKRVWDGGREGQTEREVIKTGGTPPNESDNLHLAMLIKETHDEHILTNYS